MARILLEAGHDPFMLAGPGASPWATACSTGSIRAAKELLYRVKGLELRLGWEKMRWGWLEGVMFSPLDFRCRCFACLFFLVAVFDFAMGMGNGHVVVSVFGKPYIFWRILCGRPLQQVVGCNGWSLMRSQFFTQTLAIFWVEYVEWYFMIFQSLHKTQSRFCLSMHIHILLLDHWGSLGAWGIASSGAWCFMEGPKPWSTHWSMREPQLGANSWRAIGEHGDIFVTSFFWVSNPMLYFNVFHISWERSPASKQLSREGQ